MKLKQDVLMQFSTLKDYFAQRSSEAKKEVDWFNRMKSNTERGWHPAPEFSKGNFGTIEKWLRDYELYSNVVIVLNQVIKSEEISEEQVAMLDSHGVLASKLLKDHNALPNNNRDDSSVLIVKLGQQLSTVNLKAESNEEIATQNIVLKFSNNENTQVTQQSSQDTSVSKRKNNLWNLRNTI